MLIAAASEELAAPADETNTIVTELNLLIEGHEQKTLTRQDIKWPVGPGKR